MQLLLCDENLPYPSVKYLREQGHDVKSIIDDNWGITDDLVVAISAEEKRIIITFDSDFGTLVLGITYSPMVSSILDGLRFGHGNRACIFMNCWLKASWH